VRTDIEDVKCKMNLVHTIVSTLSRCPPNILKEQLSYIVLKLTDYLRHKSYDVRQAARRAACDCIDLLGPDFLFTVLSQLRSELTRGAHKHVLLRCCCDMIQTLNNSGKAQSGDVDRKTMVLMVEIMQEDLFGRLGEDKRAAEVRAKIPEAKGNGHQRIYECLQFLGFAIDCNENCSETNRLSNIRALINPFYQQAVNTKEARVKHVIKDSFEKIKVGLMKSTFFEPIDYLNLVYSLLSENDLEAFFVGKKTEKTEKKVIKPGMRPESCLILNNAPRRQGMKPVVKNKKSNLHLIVEFALSLLHQVITVGVGCEDGDKRKIVLSLLDEDDEEQAETRNLLNKLVEMCEKCLVAQHRETVKQALNCLKPLLRTNLSEMRARIEEIAKKIFKIIEDDDKGMGDAETTNIAFQTLTTLCNSDYKVALTDTNLRTLMVYADSKLLDTEQQGNSFKLVEAVLRRGFENDDVKSTMANIREIMIRNQSSDTRERASRLYFLYLRMFGPKMDKKKYTLNRQVEFVLQNFSFEYAANRLSVMDFMVKLIGEYPDKYVARSMHKDIFVMTMDRLGKDQEKRCREKLVEVIYVLLQSIDNNQRDELYNDFVIQRYKSGNAEKDNLAAMIIPLYSKVMGTNFNKKLGVILPLLLQKLENNTATDNDTEKELKKKDLGLKYNLNLAKQLIEDCRLLDCSGAIGELVEKILAKCNEFLLHLCDDIGRVAATIMTLYVDHLELKAEKNEKVKRLGFVNYLANNCCKQLNNYQPDDELQLMDQLMANRRVVEANLHKVIRYHCSLEDRDDPEDKDHDVLVKLVRKMNNMSKIEQLKRPKQILQRASVVKAIDVLLDSMTSRPFDHDDHVVMVTRMFEAVHRGHMSRAMHGDEQGEDISKLNQVSAECKDRLKKKIGKKLFDKLLTEVTQQLSDKKEKRKQKKMQLEVLNPQLAALKKMKRNERKRKNKNNANHSHKKMRESL